MSRSDIQKMMENHLKKLKLFDCVLLCEEEQLEKQKKQVLQKSIDLFQQLQRKQQIKINYLAAPIICIEFACKLLHENLNKDLAIKLTGLSPNDYNTSANMAQNLLGLQFEISTTDLCSKFGYPSSLAEQVDTLFQTFKTKFLESLKLTEQKQRANFNDSTFKAVALYIILKQNRKTIDRDQLIQAVNSTQKKFDLLFVNMCSILEISMDSLVQAEKPPSTSNKTEITFKKKSSNSKQDEEYKGENAENIPKRTSSNRNTATKRKTISLDENDKIVQNQEAEDEEAAISRFVAEHKVQQKNDNILQPNPKRLKQSTLSNFLV